MFLLSYITVIISFLLAIPFLFKNLRINNENAIRSLSGMLCVIRPYGHLLMNTANLCLFLIISIEYPWIAWVFWISLQLIITFDIDTNPWLHLAALLFYITMLITFWIHICLKYDWLMYTLQIWIFTGLFCLIWLYNMWTGRQWEESGIVQFRWKYNSLQSVVELCWIAAIVVTFFLYEKKIKEEYGMKSYAVSI